MQYSDFLLGECSGMRFLQRRKNLAESYPLPFQNKRQRTPFIERLLTYYRNIVIYQVVTMCIPDSRDDNIRVWQILKIIRGLF